MACRRHLAIVFSACLLANAFCVPADLARRRRGFNDNELDSSSETAVSFGNSASKSSEPSETSAPPVSTSTVDLDSFEDDDDEVYNEPMQSSPTTGSNIFSLLRLAGALFPSSSGANLLTHVFREMLGYNIGPGFHQGNFILRRQDVGDNEIEIDYIQDLKPPPLQKQEIDETSSSSESEEDSNGDEDDASDDAAEESVENGNGNSGDRASEQNDDSDSNGNDYDSDEPPEGDGQGGGILGILAGLSGGEDGQSDLGSLLATVSGIVANLSGDGIDLNALIASGIGLFAGLLSEGEENPGAVIASYLLTSLDTITGGGAKNNGAFFGNLVSKLVKGTSAAGDPDASSEEEGNGGMKMADSAGFLLSLVSSLLGDMSKGSSGGSSAWRRDGHAIAFEPIR